MDTVRISLVRHHHLHKVDIVWLCCGTVNMVCCDVPIHVLFSSCVKHIFGRTTSIVGRLKIVVMLFSYLIFFLHISFVTAQGCFVY